MLPFNKLSQPENVPLFIPVLKSRVFLQEEVVVETPYLSEF